MNIQMNELHGIGIHDNSFGSVWRNLLNFAMFMFEQKIFIITFMVSFNHCWSLHRSDFQFPWFWCTPKLFDRLNFKSKVKTTKGWRVGARFLAHSTSGVEGRVGTPGWRLGRETSESIIHTNLHKSNNKLVNA